MTTLRDRSLNTAFQPMQSRIGQGEKLKKSDITTLIDATSDGRGVSKTEAKDLQKVLDSFSSNMTPAARRTLEAFIQNAGQGPSTGLSSLQLRIQTAGIRNTLTSGSPSMIDDRVINAPEAQKLIDVVKRNGIVSKTEKKDIAAILDNPNLTIAPADRQLLSDLIGRFSEPRSGVVRGSDVQSAHVDANKSYRTEGFPTAILGQLGVDADVQNILKRADALTGTGNTNGRVSLTELSNLENNAALLPAETVALAKAFALFEVGSVGAPTEPQVPSLDVTDTSVRPSRLSLNAAEVSVADLPTRLQTVAQRARLVAKGAGADLTKVSLADIKHAITQDHGQTTAGDRDLMASDLVDAMKPLAIDVVRTAPLQASATFPELESKTQSLVGQGSFNLDLVSTTSLTGAQRKRGSWSHTMAYHRHASRGRSTTPLHGIPKSSDTSFALRNDVQLSVNIPPGHKLLLVSTTGQHQVFNPGRHDAPAGDHRAVLFKDGAIVDEASVRIPKEAQKDVSAYMGFDLVTESNKPISLSFTGGTRGENYRRNFAGSSSPTATDDYQGKTPTTLTPGRYEGKVATAYNRDTAFVLDVLNPNVFEATVGGKKIRLHPVSHRDNLYEGHIDESGRDHQVLQFDASSNSLRVINEELSTYHTATSWQGRVKEDARAPTVVGSEMMTG